MGMIRRRPFHLSMAAGRSRARWPLDHLPQPKSAVADFGHFVEWPNPRYSEVRLGGGGPARAGREGVTALPHTRRRRHVLRRRHPTPDSLRQPAPPPPETAFTRVSATPSMDLTR